MTHAVVSRRSRCRPPCQTLAVCLPMVDLPLGRRFWRARPRLTRATLLSGCFAIAFAIGIAWSSWSLVCREGACPDPTQLDAFQPRQTSKLYAVDGRFIAELGLERRTLVKLTDIPKPVQQAFIITEDKRFYEHAGIDWIRVFGAFAADVVHRNFAQGFSTLTMQLARNIFSEKISREKTLTRKLKEAKVARQIEARYPKQKILELYLNQIYLGNGAYGVETAAQHYFGKSVRELNLAEAATLAALPKGPERYNPRKYPDRAIQRRNTIIGLMRKEGVVTDADARLAQAYPLQLARKAESGELAPYFVEFVRRQLEQQFGDKIYTDGLKIYSKFDRATQALRQPGSTFKPIVYSDAIHNGKSASYMLNDSALTVPQISGQDWTPQNYDLKFMGNIPLREALYLSRNLAAIRLGMELGESSVIEMARKFGITTPIPPYPSIHIGSADVYPIEMVAAYSAFATLGVRAVPNAVLKVENAKGETLWEGTPARFETLSREEAWLMVDMMKDVVRRGSAASVWASGFHIPAGGKTGTTNDGTDVWFIGYTPDLVTGIWMGFDRPQKIQSNAQGGRLVAPAWTAYMSEIYQRRPSPPDWPRPEGLVTREIDRTDGMLRNPFCPDSVVINEFYIEGTEPVQECNVHGPFGIIADSARAGAAAPPVAQPDPFRVVPRSAPIPRPSRVPTDTAPKTFDPFHPGKP